jgi:hypothetical protein
MIDSKFEEFAKDRGLNTEKLCHGDYKLFVTGEAYAAWQAASAQDGGEPEWTNVNEKLPIDVGQVLMVFNEPLFVTSNPTIEIGYYDKESEAWRFWTFDKEVNGFGVTHWMPLPALPQQEQDPLN